MGNSSVDDGGANWSALHPVVSSTDKPFNFLERFLLPDFAGLVDFLFTRSFTSLKLDLPSLGDGDFADNVPLTGEESFRFDGSGRQALSGKQHRKRRHLF
ncbi:unnamed protein product [Schistosoma curassoni]|uniref:Uncharacterized protein n=1 Tax=Schistosoma curassoni TaxID=6186 RepID=A0A183JD68_9TREM|nr:unnamed protein product [Schistosoma curassoni]